MGGIVGRYMVFEVFFYVLTVFFDDMVSEVGGGRVFIAQDMVPDFFDIVFEFHTRPRVILSASSLLLFSTIVRAESRSKHLIDPAR